MKKLIKIIKKSEVKLMNKNNVQILKIRNDREKINIKTK